MKKSRKPTLVEERHFPFECSTSYGVSDDYTALHWHKELEICYIRQGTGNYLINGTEYPFSGGDIFLIGNDEIHLCHDDRDLIMQVFMFAPEFVNSGYANPFDYEFLRPFYERTERFCNKIEKDAAVSLQLVTASQALYEGSIPFARSTDFYRRIVSPNGSFFCIRSSEISPSCPLKRLRPNRSKL